MIKNGARSLRFLFEQQLFDGLNQRHVAVELHLQENIRKSRFDTQRAFHRLRIRERDQSGFRQWVDRNNGRAALFRFLQRA